MPIINPPFRKQRYAGLNTAEATLLRQYLAQLETEVRGLETHIPLGPGETQAEFVREEYRRAWQFSSQLKLDALIETPSEYHLVELKDLIRTSALGQLLCYRYWLQIERDLEKPVRLVATSEELNPSVVQPYRQHNVELVPLSQDALTRLEAGLTAEPPFFD